MSDTQNASFDVRKRQAIERLKKTAERLAADGDIAGLASCAAQLSAVAGASEERRPDDSVLVTIGGRVDADEGGKT